MLASSPPHLPRREASWLPRCVQCWELGEPVFRALLQQPTVIPLETSDAPEALFDPASHGPAFAALARAIETYRSYSPIQSSIVCQTFLLVATRGPIGPAEIAARLDIAPSIACSALDALDSGGRAGNAAPARLVTRIGDAEDARLRPAAPTPVGAQLAKAMSRALTGRS